jgi:hypothetical protein
VARGRNDDSGLPRRLREKQFSEWLIELGLGDVDTIYRLSGISFRLIAEYTACRFFCDISIFIINGFVPFASIILRRISTY